MVFCHVLHVFLLCVILFLVMFERSLLCGCTSVLALPFWNISLMVEITRGIKTKTERVRWNEMTRKSQMLLPPTVNNHDSVILFEEYLRRYHCTLFFPSLVLCHFFPLPVWNRDRLKETWQHPTVSSLKGEEISTASKRGRLSDQSNVCQLDSYRVLSEFDRLFLFILPGFSLFSNWTNMIEGRK